MNILMIEDDDTTRYLLDIFLKSLSIRVEKVKTAKEALVVVKRYRPDLIILDICLGDGIGVSVVEECKRLYSPIPPIIVISAIQNIEKIIGDLPIKSLLKKPFNLEDLEKIVLNSLIKQ